VSEQLEKWIANGRYFEHLGHRIFYRRHGSGDALVCLHGFPSSSFDQHKIWPELSRRFEVISFDMIGYGFSDKPTDLGYTTFDQADLFEALLSNLGVERVHILSHDYGNTITLELLARASESGLDFEIESICFLNGALFPETHRPILAQKILISPIGAVFGRLIPDRVFKKNLASVFGPNTKPTEAELEDFLALFKHNNGKRIAHKLIRYMSERAKYRERWLRSLNEMTQPFRFINGLADPVSGEHLVRRFREVVSGPTDIIELPGIGHFPHFEAPEIVAEKFLEFHDRFDLR
jgi:pimeloyl-ACP methyl ester carboxylesterase